MSTIPNRNYRIGTDVLPDGKVRAKAHGRKTNAKTFMAGTTPHDAAAALAASIEGERYAEVRNYLTFGTKADWDVYVTVGA